MAVRIERVTRWALEARVADAFVAEDAIALHEALERSEPGIAVSVDLHESRRSEPVALARLAADILSGRWRIELHGICWYDIRLLAHLGVPARELGTSPAEQDS